eukprot:gene9913-50299_t
MRLKRSAHQHGSDATHDGRRIQGHAEPTRSQANMRP